MPPTVRLLPAVDGDRDFVASVWRAVAPLYDPLLPGAFAYEARIVERRGLSSRYDTLLVHAGEARIGFAGITRLRPRTAYLAQLYVLPAWQRQGHGAAALRQLETWVPDADELVLHVHRQASWARAFYARQGYDVWAADEPASRTWGDGVLAGWTPPATLLLGRRWR